MSHVFSKDKFTKTVLDYSPKSLDHRDKDAAKSFVYEDTPDENNFQISPIVAEQSGVAEVKRQKIRDEIEAKVKEKFEELKEQARQEGFAQGVKDGIQEVFKANESQIQEQIAKIQSIATEFDTLKKDMLKQSEHQIMTLIYHLATRLAQKEISEKPEVVLNLIDNMLENVQKDERVKIYLNQEDLDFINSSEEFSQKVGKYKNVKFEPKDNITRGGAELETNFVSIDATLETRAQKIWDSLYKSLPDISNQNLDLSDDTSGEPDES